MADQHLIDILNTEGLGRLIKVFADRNIDSTKFFDLPESLINFCFHNDAEAREKLKNLIKFKDFVKSMLVKSPAPKRKKPNTQSQSSVKTPQTVERNSQLKSDPQVYVEIPFVDQSDPLGISNVEENIPTAADEEDSGGENDYEAGADIPEKVKVAIENLNHLENFFTPKQRNNPYYKLLSSEYNFRGQLILYHYATSQNLLYIDEMVKMVILYELGQSVKKRSQYKIPFRLVRGDFERITKAILELFPTEEPFTFYRPSFGSRRSKNPEKRQNSGGKLYHKYLKVRMEIMAKTKLIQSRNASKNQTAELEETQEEEELEEVDEDNVNQILCVKRSGSPLL